MRAPDGCEPDACPTTAAAPRESATRTLVHVVPIDKEPDPVTVMWFRAVPEELHALLAIGDPFSRGWDDGLVTMVLRDDGSTDWGEVKELLTESYCLLAPKKLTALLDAARPPDEIWSPYRRALSVVMRGLGRGPQGHASRDNLPGEHG